MQRKILEFEKITNNKWVNLFAMRVRNSKGYIINWIFASRKEKPVEDKSIDAVIIIPVVDTDEGKKLVVIKEYRWAIDDFEYGFPAGLMEGDDDIRKIAAKELKEETGMEADKIVEISNPVFSSPGLTDESCVMVFVEASGETSTEYQEAGEDIEIVLMGVKDIVALLADKNKKVGAKAWGILYYYAKIGRIE